MKLRNYREPETIKTKFYYIREPVSDGKGFPVVTVCLKYDISSGEISRGIAICAMDLEKEYKRSKRTGRGIAETRARWAMHNNKQHLKIKNIGRFNEVAQRFVAENDFFWYCDNRPELTQLEMEVLGLFKLPKTVKNALFVTQQPAILPTENGLLRNFLNKFKIWTMDILNRGGGFSSWI